MKFYKVHIVHRVTLPQGKHIDDYAIEFEDFEKMENGKNQPLNRSKKRSILTLNEVFFG